ncbi:MAG: alpha/beta fold hydrolase [Minisyncoccia bacterium]
MEKIIFLHGWINKYIIDEKSDIFEFYKDLIEELRKSFDVYFVYLPGFDKKKLERPYNLDDYVEYLKKFVDENNLNNFILIGHSFGGQIAAKFSYLYPEKVKKLILYNSACIRRKGLKEKIFSIFKKPGKIIFNTFPFFRKLFYKIFTGSTAYLKLPENFKKTMQNVLNEDLTNILPSIKNKTLILWGEKDKITPLWQGKLINRLIKGSKLIIQKNGNHSFHKNFLQEFSEYVKNFIFDKI